MSGANVSDIAKYLPIPDGQFEVGQMVKVSFCGGAFVFGKISAILLSGPVLMEEDGTETVIPIEDIEDRATLVYLTSTAQDGASRECAEEARDDP